jgi:hypothetical protein
MFDLVIPRFKELDGERADATGSSDDLPFRFKTFFFITHAAAKMSPRHGLFLLV